MNSHLDDVNELLKRGVGDRFRLEHLKKTLESNRVLYISDRKYLEELVKEYLIDFEGKKLTKFNKYDYPEYENKVKGTTHSDSEPFETKTPKFETKITKTEPSSSVDTLYCWKCGKANTGTSKFCNDCGSEITRIETQTNVSQESIHVSQTNVSPQASTVIIKEKGMGFGKKLLIGIGALTLILIIGAIIIGGAFLASISQAMNEQEEFENELFEGLSSTHRAAYSAQIEQCKSNMGYLQSEEMGKLLEDRCMQSIINSIEAKKSQTTTSQTVTTPTTSEPNSKCGPGTVFDDATNSCVLEGTQTTSSNSKCGPGTVFDEETNSCIVP